MSIRKGNERRVFRGSRNGFRWPFLESETYPTLHIRKRI